MTRTITVLAIALTALPASAQEHTAAVIAPAPIYNVQDTDRLPLRTVPVGVILTVVEDNGKWLRVEFQDPRLGRQVGYVQARHVQRNAVRPTAGRESCVPSHAEAAAAASAADLPPGIVAHMTPELILEAIDAGETKRVSAVPVQAKGSWGASSLPMATFTTPYLRVALRAADAKKKYQRLRPEDIEPADLEPVIHVFANSRKASKGPGVYDVQAMVIMPANSKDRDLARHPLAAKPMTEQWRNMLGYTDEGSAMFAIFPLSVLRKTNELRVVYGDMERSGKFNLKNVK